MGEVVMFETCEWNNEGEERSPSPGMEKRRSKSGTEEKGSGSRKQKLKRNQQLLEVLRSLSTPSTLHPDLPQHPDPTAPKRLKKAKPRASSTDVLNPEAPPPEAPPQSAERPSEASERLSRRQWKNKQKNKRKNRNKFKDVTEEEGAGATGQGAGATGRGAGEKNPGNHRDCKMSGGGDAPPTSGGSAQNRQHAGGRQTSDETCQQDGDSRVTQQPEADTSAELRSRMQQRLTRARFRYINEQLYTRHSQEAAQLFQEDPEAFSIYHSGFSQQLQRWPLNPITQIIKYIKNRPPSLVIADFGCGDALLARSVRNIVHSFDLVALNDRVTVCDMAEVPLPDGSVDVAVFCLSLMGKNLSDFLREANRVLKTSGVLLVAEVSSRFDDIRQFLQAMSHLGFKSVNKNVENSHFYLFEFSKSGRARDASRHAGLQLKPCLYKKR
ncbi:ribosomal RNA-processing protein 8 [Engystomops pustulosus]|uniref:ribosomal RNA-processing protein 8 n=1 Tax=Engystomops pustulosus TaxID=76066 RepID=UPI003AFAA909